jgi:hypothetical protein
MRFWFREIAGWVLVLLGLLMFYECLDVLVLSDRHMIFEAGSLVLIGIFLFRGGIHLLKVAVAARICVQTQEKLAAGGDRARPSRFTAPARRPASGWGP